METFYPTDAGRNVLVLVIEDEKVSRMALGLLLARQGYTTETVGSAEEAVAVLTIGQRPTVALVDLDLPGMSGAELVVYMAQNAPAVRTVLVTAACQERIAKIVDGTPISYLRKPIDFKALLQMLDLSPVTN